MSNTFEFAERFGVESFFKEEAVSNEHKYFWTGDINFQKLIDHIKDSSVINIKNYDSFFKGQQIKVGGSGFNRGKFKGYLKGVNEMWSIPSFSPKKSKIPIRIGEEDFFYNGYIVNTYSTTPSTISKSKIEYGASIKIDDEYYRYRILFPFNGNQGKFPSEKYGIIIETDNYYDYEVLLNYLNIQFPLNIKKQIIDKFKLAFNNAKGDCNIIDAIYEFAPNFIVQDREDNYLWDDLVTLSKCTIDRETTFSGTDENISVLNILLNFSDTSYAFNQFRKYPELIETLLNKIDADYTIDFLRALSTICVPNWKTKQLEEALRFIAEPVEYFADTEPNYVYLKIVGWCFYNKEKKRYQIGYNGFSYKSFDSLSPDKEVNFSDGFSDILDPLETSFGGEVLYIPTIAAAYITFEEVLETKLILFGNFLDGFIGSPSSVINAVNSATKSLKASRVVVIRSRISKRFKKAYDSLKLRIKN